MAWLDPSQPTIAMVFEDPDGHTTTVELFPSRVDAPNGLLDGIRGLAAAMLVAKRGLQWHHHLDASLNGQGGATNPFLSVRAGGLQIGHHAPLPGAHRWTLSDTTITEPDGTTWPLDSYMPPLFYDPQRAGRFTPSYAGHLDALIGATLVGLDGLPVHDHPFFSPCTFATLAGPLLTPAPRARRLRTNEAHIHATTLVHKMMEAWIVRPNRVWMPEHYVCEHTLDTVAEQLEDTHADAFVACVRDAFALFSQAPVSTRQACWHHTSGSGKPTSAHETLASTTLVQNVAAHLCHHGNRWFSMPSTTRRKGHHHDHATPAP